MARAGLARAEDEIRHELAELTPLLQVPDLLAQLSAQVRVESDAKRDTLLVEAFSTRDEALLEKLAEAKVERIRDLVGTCSLKAGQRPPESQG